MPGFVDPITVITRDPSTRHKHMLTSCDSGIWENNLTPTQTKTNPVEKQKMILDFKAARTQPSNLMTDGTCETLDSLIDFSWVCMWQRRCQWETRQHFIFHQRRAWSAPLTLDAKRLEMSSGDRRAHPLVVSITVTGTVSSLPGPLLPLRLKNIDDSREGWWRCFSEEGGKCTAVVLGALAQGFLAGPVQWFWSGPEGEAARGEMARESWHLTRTGAGWGRQGRSQGPPGSVCACVCACMCVYMKQSQTEVAPTGM